MVNQTIASSEKASEEAPYGYRQKDGAPKLRPGRPRKTPEEKISNRKRTVEEGRIVTLTYPAAGRLIIQLAEEMGVLPNTMARILIFEALKARGYSTKRIKKEFATPEDKAHLAELQEKVSRRSGFKSRDEALGEGQ